MGKSVTYQVELTEDTMETLAVTMPLVSASLTGARFEMEPDDLAAFLELIGLVIRDVAASPGMREVLTRMHGEAYQGSRKH